MEVSVVQLLSDHVLNALSSLISRRDLLPPDIEQSSSDMEAHRALHSSTAPNIANAAADQDEVSSIIGTAIALDVAAADWDGDGDGDWDADSDADAVAKGTFDLVGVGFAFVTLVAEAVAFDASSSLASGDITRSSTYIRPLFVLDSVSANSSLR